MTTERKRSLLHALWRVITYSTELGVVFLFMVNGWLPVYGTIALSCFLFVVTYEKMHTNRSHKC